jgi:DNA polymerase elongation subunit (family B)
MTALPSATSSHDDGYKGTPVMHGRSAFVIVLFATRVGGEKIAIELRDIPVYFDIRVPELYTPEKFMDSITQTMAPIRARIISRTPFKGYHRQPVSYIRVYFATLAQRREAINGNTKYEMANDNTNYEHMMYAKYSISPSGWIQFMPIDELDTYKIFAYAATIKSIKQITDPTDSKYLTRNTLLCNYDIEVPSDTVGALPTADKYEVGSIALTFHWDDMAIGQRLVGVIITHYNADPDAFLPDIVIKTRNEKETLQAFFDCIERMAPDTISGFNSGGFDDKYVYDRCMVYGAQFVKMCMRTSSQHNWRSSYWPSKPSPIKIPSMGGNIDTHLFQFYGCVNFDVRPLMMCAVQKVRQSSLDAFLKMWKLPRKINMAISHMNELFAANEPAGIYAVLDYNLHDSQCCFNLLRKKNSIIDKRSVGVEAYVPLKNTLMNADIGRVINLTHNIAIMRKYAMSTNFRHTSGGQQTYEGALVLDPVRGIQTIKPKLSELAVLPAERLAEIEAMLTPANYALLCAGQCTLNISPTERQIVLTWAAQHISRPIFALDFESLYPSLMISYNLSPDTVIDTSDPLMEQAFRATHADILDEFTYVETDDNIRGFVRKHNNDPANYGIFAQIQNSLKSKRIVMKKLWIQYKVRRESEDDTNGELAFMESYYFIKQNTMKVFMNSIYGNMGMSGSPLNMRIIAAAITHYGRFHLARTKAYVEQLGNIVVYGDTDSLYIQLNGAAFATLDADFYTGKLSRVEYGTASVALTQKQLPTITQTVNTYVAAETTNNILRMAFEEVLFPAIWLTRKKYMGIPHIKEIDFNLGRGYEYITNYNKVLKFDIAAETPLFVKGYDIVKRTTSRFSSNIASSVIFAMLDINNHKSVRDLIDTRVRSILDLSYDVKLFKKYGKYQLHKGGIAHDFYEFTKLNTPNDLPPPMKYFGYILRAGNYEKKGHKWVVTARAIADNIQPDIRDYYEAELVGMLSRFIATDADIGSNDTAKYYLKMIHADRFPVKLKERITGKLAKIGATSTLCSLLTDTWALDDIIAACEEANTVQISPTAYLTHFRKIIAAVYGADSADFANNLVRRLVVTARGRADDAKNQVIAYVNNNCADLLTTSRRIQHILNYIHKTDDTPLRFENMIAVCNKYTCEYSNYMWLSSVCDGM